MLFSSNLQHHINKTKYQLYSLNYTIKLTGKLIVKENDTYYSSDILLYCPADDTVEIKIIDSSITTHMQNDDNEIIIDIPLVPYSIPKDFT